MEYETGDPALEHDEFSEGWFDFLEESFEREDPLDIEYDEE